MSNVRYIGNETKKSEEGKVHIKNGNYKNVVQKRL